MIADGRMNNRPTDEQIARKAHELWMSEGCPEGRAFEHWCTAEKMLMNEPANNSAGDEDRSSGDMGRNEQPGRSPEQAQQPQT
jgi:hypothetical protein